MKQVTIKLYEFTELTDTAKTIALREMQDINVGYNWWDFILEDFKTICHTIGIETDVDEIYFRGFYSQGDGSGFNATINLRALIEGVRQQSWKDYAPDFELNIATPPFSHRVLQLIEKGIIEFDPAIKYSRRGTNISVQASYDFTVNRCTNYNNIDTEVSRMEKWVTAVAHALNNYLYQILKDEYDERISEEAIIEALIANEYVFTSDGKPATRIERLAE